jgi:hypothetical protein
MSARVPTAPGLTAADRGSLVLTDISGYTSYLLGTELEHAQDVLSDLMGVVVSNLQPPLHVSKLEGDAVFSYALDGVCGASTLLDTIERSYFAFRSRQRDIAHATSCACDACRQIPTLDLKFIVHHGTFVRSDRSGNEELTGRDVIVLHRLAKNSAADILGTKGYVLLTDECMSALGLDGAALGMRAHVERYDDVGEISCCLEDLGERWQAEAERQRVYVAAKDASFERTMTVPVDRTVAWEWMTAAEKRVLYAADDVTLMSPGGRQRPGVTNHCMHGPEVIIEHIRDWHPFDYFTKSYELPGVGEMPWTFELAEEDGATTISVRGEPLSGERLAAWSQLEGDVLAMLDHNAQGLVEQLSRVALETRASPLDSSLAVKR